MGERRGMKALELWCKRVTDGYDQVKVENMTTSWRDGLAFCAIIHHFRPDLIDFGSLNKADIYRNNELAFRTAELHLGIPALLDAEDMVECSMPDRLSILTYLSQFYQTFAGSRQSTSPNHRTPQGGKRSASPSTMSPTTQTPPTKMALLGPSRREPCAKCHLPVFIAERLLVGGRTLYHRTCFRCARCQHQLSVANCYETEDGQYCCETCPDEVEQKKDNTPTIDDMHSLNDTHSLSSVKNYASSVDFESVLESEKIGSVDGSAVTQDVVSSKARADFMIGQLEWKDEEVVSPHPDLSTSNSEVESMERKELGDSLQTLHAVDSSHVNTDANLEAFPYSDNSNSVEISTYFSTKTNSLQGETEATQKVAEQVPSSDSIKCSDSNNQPLTANDRQEDCLNDQKELITTCTKETDLPPTSIVKMRMKMFDVDHTTSLHKHMPTSNLDGTSFDSNRKTDNDVSASELHQAAAQLSDVATEDESTFKNTLVDKLSEDVDVHLVETDDTLEASTHSELSDKEIVEDLPDVPLKLEEEPHEEPFESDTVAINNLKSRDLELNASVKSDIVVDHEDCLPEGIAEQNSFQTVDSTENNSDIVASQSGKTEIDISPVKTVIDSDLYPEDLNPFGDDGADEESEAVVTSPSMQVNTNPFGSSDEDEVTLRPKASPAMKPPRPPQPLCRQSLTLHSNDSKISPMPRQSLTLGPSKVADVSLNPFWSEGDEPSSDEETRPIRAPVPLPRTQKNMLNLEPSPVPRLRRSSGQFGSGTSMSSNGSSANSTMHRKKKPAPPPPLPPASTHPNASPQPPSSPRTTPRHRKARPAPPPPDAMIDVKDKRVGSYSEVECEREKNEKDEENRIRQTRKLIIPTEEQSAAMIAPNKSTFGQWKRKKGPAPPRPVPPQRREIRVMPMKEVKRELDDIEVQQLGLERQGVSLEKTIRAKFEQTSTVDEQTSTVDGTGTDIGETPDVEDLVLQLFEIVNEKNELFRRQAELMYLRRQHRLEEEHADLEYEIRCLMMRPEHTKTDTDKAYEEELIQRQKFEKFESRISEIVWEQFERASSRHPCSSSSRKIESRTALVICM